jgi:upstream activation factor subunit UAF30
MERFDIFNARQNSDPAPVKSIESADNTPTVNGSHQSAHVSHPSPPQSKTPPKREARSQDISDVVDQARPKKKRKTSVDGDAALAAKLQAEEALLARPTRGGNTRKSAPAKKKSPKKKKTPGRVRASDDSDIESDGESKPQKTTGFHVGGFSLPSTYLTVSETSQSFSSPLNLV